MTTRFDAAGRRVLMVCAAGGFTTLLDNSVLNIALPALRDSLHADAAHVQWMVAGYSLAFGLALVPGGRLGDVRGRKPYFLAGMAIFTAGAALAGLTPGPEALVAARLLQGLGGGLVNSQMIGTMQDVFSGHARTRALGLYAVTGGVAGGLGPPLGGAVIAVAGPETGWRLVFLLAVPFGVVTLALAARHLPPAPDRAGSADLDLVGLLLMGGLTLALMLPFVQPAGGPAGLVWAPVVGLLAVSSLRWQRRYARSGRRPLLHPTLTRSAPFAAGTMVAMGYFGSGLANSLVLTMFLQEGLGLTALATATVTLPAAFAMVAGSALAWRLARRFGRHTVSAGLALSACSMLAGGLVALFASGERLPVLLALCATCASAASGLVVSPLQASVLKNAPGEAAGVAGGILQMSQRIGAAICISAVSGIYLHGSSAGGPGYRPAFWHAALTCAGVAALACVLSYAANRRAVRPPVAEVRPG
ncbi:MFS transporter [Microtetraspora sp. NBRC 13810]|uniref:MFS transporter n=1 Tax=Microtetraspora sp. NBRC 13810 TaxID=3030990 RepID=UPI0024A388DD|nr:MFS transporter [Microtetraspora sp. NBRC 13810]GLW07237.1 MFS transporter [Microtetraspora sp. NBRC 13810]